jgi:predicted transcriptional regulator
MTEGATVRLPDDLVAKAKRKALAEGRSLTALIEEGLRRVVAEPAPARSRRQKPLPVGSAAGGLALE